MVFAVPHNTVLISDGGLAAELEAGGRNVSDDLWSARLLLDASGRDRRRPRRLLPRRCGIRYSREPSGLIRWFRGRRNRTRHRVTLPGRRVELARTARDIDEAQPAHAFAVAVVNCCAPADIRAELSRVAAQAV